MDACADAACESCGAAGVALVCARCRVVCYCDVVCQRARWPAHKADCKASVAALGGALGSAPVSLRTAEPKLALALVRQVYFDQPTLPVASSLEFIAMLLKKVFAPWPAADVTHLTMRQVDVLLAAILVFTKKQEAGSITDCTGRIDGTGL